MHTMSKHTAHLKAIGLRSDNDTLSYIVKHKQRIVKWMEVFINELRHRAAVHDNSKLEEPELSGWKAMDREPRYQYGTKEYYDKVARYKWLMELHWRRNRHHPEYWQIWQYRRDRDLIDYIEMLVDWLSYSDKKLSYRQARELVAKQAARYHMDEPGDLVNNPPMSQLLLNTITNYFVEFGGQTDFLDSKHIDKQSSYNDSIDKGQIIDIEA